MLFSHVTHYYQTCIFGFKFTVSQIHALLSYIPWWMLLLIVGCDLLINPQLSCWYLNLLSLSMFASTSSVSKYCAFLEGQDGSRYLGLFRALHLHGITDSKCHRLSFQSFSLFDIWCALIHRLVVFVKWRLPLLTALFTTATTTKMTTIWYDTVYRI